MSHTEVVEKIETILCSIIFFENRAFYEVMWKNIEPDKPQMKKRRMRIACWIPKATNAHTQNM